MNRQLTSLLSRQALGWLMNRALRTGPNIKLLQQRAFVIVMSATTVGGLLAITIASTLAGFYNLLTDAAALPPLGAFACTVVLAGVMAAALTLLVQAFLLRLHGETQVEDEWPFDVLAKAGTLAESLRRGFMQGLQDRSDEPELPLEDESEPLHGASVIDFLRRKATKN